MATVILPMGYPIQIGESYLDVIYQGNAVRSYTLATDPRTLAQLNNRRFLADVGKTRSTLGTWGKRCGKTAMGSKWGSVLYQVIKANTQEWWSDAIAAWGNFGDSAKNAWRSAAPYQATWNDPGEIFYGVARSLHHAYVHYAGVNYYSEEWADNESAAALTWWGKLQESEMIKGIYDSTSTKFIFTGNWNTNGWSTAYGQSVKQTVNDTDAFCEFYYYGTAFQMMYIGANQYGSCKIFLDNVLKNTFSQYNEGELSVTLPTYSGIYKGVHYVKVLANGGDINIDRVEIF